MTEDKLKKLEELYKKASEGPWDFVVEDFSDEDEEEELLYLVCSLCRGCDYEDCEATPENPKGRVGCITPGSNLRYMTKEDAEFIATIHNETLGLIEEIRNLKKENSDMAMELSVRVIV